MTTSLIDYALMAGASYISNRAPINRFPAPDVWLENIQKRTTKDSGFEATYFVGVNNEIVISFAGTDFNNLISDFVYGNIPLMTGVSINGADQLADAVEYYLTVKAANPNTTITLTGHSLGGALAALVGVFFGEKAFTFDQVPAANAAQFSATALRDALLAKGHTPTELAGLESYIQLQQASGSLLTPIPNAGLVSNINVQGELASLTFADRIGSEASINSEHPGVGPSDLHSIALLTAMLQSGDTKDSTSTDHTLGQVTYKLTDLLKMIFDPNLYYNDPLKIINPKENFLERLVRHQAGVQPDAATTAAIAADTMVTRFTADLWKLAQDGGLTLSDWPQLNGSAVPRNVSDALIAFAMQKYYEEQAGRTGTGKTLFQNVSGGIQFDTGAVVGAGNSITSAKGYVQYFEQYLNQVAPGGTQFTAGDRQIIQSMLTTLHDWYVQAGASGMVATDTRNNGAFMLGGKDSDSLTGGGGNDLLVGNAGNDILKGGKGDDTLLGGADNDTYIINTGDGNDTIDDKQGNNTVIFNGRSVAMLFRQQDGSFRTADGVITGAMVGTDLILTDTANGGTLTLNKDFQEGDFGIKFYDPLAGALPETSTPTDAAEHVWDTAAFALGGDDVVTGTDDGQGYTAYQALTAENVLIDVAFNETLQGDSGNDHVYSEHHTDYLQFTTDVAIDKGNTDTGSGNFGDILLGNAGDDTLFGGLNNDALMGGTGNDLIIAGAGDDQIYGDREMDGAPTQGSLRNSTCVVLCERSKREAANDAEWRVAA